jgi:uncharacterized membrane protein
MNVARLRYRALRDQLRESLLFLPGLMFIVAVVLAIVFGKIDASIDQERVPAGLSLSSNVALTLLGTIAGGTITTAGVVFSLLVVSLQLASGQFSPRVLRGFYRDRYGQVLVGLLLATFAFCVLALGAIHTDSDRAPALVVGFALLLSLASVVAIVIYLDRISRSQYVGRIMERVVNETHQLIQELPYGKRIGVRVGEPVDPPDVDALGPCLVVRAPADGWIQQISKRGVLAAVPDGTVVRLETRVGAFLIRGTPLASVWPVPANAQGTARLMAEAAILGPARSMQQDIDFGLRQLKDIGLRALSTDTNDPTTAVEVVVRLASIVRPLLLAELPAQSVRDPHGRILLTPYDLDHREYVRHAFNQIRTYAAPHPHVGLALVRCLRMLRTECGGVATAPGAETTARDAALAELDRQLRLAVEAGHRSGLAPDEIERLERTAAV